MLIITHYRYLLNHCFNKILHIENKELQEFNGRYIDYNFALLQSKIELQELATAADRARVLFHVLSAFGHADLAYGLITKTSFPSYGNLVARGFTTLPEAFYLEDDKWVSLNHHFFGDISGWFFKSILGINLNPFDRDCKQLILSPHFIGKLDHAQGYHQAPGGRVDVSFRRESGHILLTVGLTGSLYGEIRLNDGCLFEDGLQCKPLINGEYVIRLK